jgi:uncharacterized delta-60 repeat protein
VLFGADQLALARYTPQGILDGTFGDGGKVVLDGGTMVEAIRALALDPDGTIVAAGQVVKDSSADFAAVRYDPHGRLDPSFGQGGLATFDFQGREDRAHALVLQPDGGIVAVGQSETDFAVARFRG